VSDPTVSDAPGQPKAPEALASLASPVTDELATLGRPRQYAKGKKGRQETFPGGLQLDPAEAALMSPQALRAKFYEGFGEHTSSSNLKWLREKLCKPLAPQGDASPRCEASPRQARDAVESVTGSKLMGNVETEPIPDTGAQQPAGQAKAGASVEVAPSPTSHHKKRRRLEGAMEDAAKDEAGPGQSSKRRQREHQEARDPIEEWDDEEQREEANVDQPIRSPRSKHAASAHSSGSILVFIHATG
ncbi:hypothetical protein CYMTET_32261, partial [Cymbomonas tetramitiformis]